MPLDTGAMMDDVFTSPGVGGARGETAPAPLRLQDAEHVGAALRAARLHAGLTLEQVIKKTHVKRSYLLAIEDMRLDQLPSRPFIIGFIRAYAEVVGVEPDLAVARFKRDNPERSTQLRAPFGLTQEGGGRGRLMIAIGIVVFASILAWNIIQRAMSAGAPPPPAVADTPANSRPAVAISSQNPVSLGAPTAPPPEATTPQAYVTPGLQAATAESDAPVMEQPKAPAGDAIPADAPAVFKAKGRVYGAAPNASVVTLQARKAATLVIHNAGGGVVFAQQMHTGESYRAPQDASLSIDVSDPAAFDLYVGGAIHAPLTQTVTPLGKIGPAATPAQGQTGR